MSKPEAYQVTLIRNRETDCFEGEVFDSKIIIDPPGDVFDGHDVIALRLSAPKYHIINIKGTKSLCGLSIMGNTRTVEFMCSDKVFLDRDAIEISEDVICRTCIGMFNRM